MNNKNFDIKQNIHQLRKLIIVITILLSVHDEGWRESAVSRQRQPKCAAALSYTKYVYRQTQILYCCSCIKHPVANREEGRTRAMTEVKGKAINRNCETGTRAKTIDEKPNDGTKSSKVSTGVRVGPNEKLAGGGGCLVEGSYRSSRTGKTDTRGSTTKSQA